MQYGTLKFTVLVIGQHLDYGVVHKSISSSFILLSYLA